MKLVFCVLASREVGYGHLSRCMSIAHYACGKGLAVEFLVLGEGGELVRRQGYVAFDATWPDGIPDLSLGEGDEQVIVILDVAHSTVLARLFEFNNLLKRLRQHADKLIAIDSLGEDSFAVAFPSIPVDAVVIPYVGGTAFPHAEATMLVGPKYAVLSSDYIAVPSRRINEVAARILVTFGGADPKALTPVVLAALARVKRKLLVRVVIGPLFSEEVVAVIEAQVKSLSHDVQLVRSPLGLLEHMLWADVAVSASGLVKYELAATGTPGVLISIDKAHDAANQPFAEARVQLDLGVTSDPGIISNSVEQLLNNVDERRRMAVEGQRLIDGKGGERLVAAMIELLADTKQSIDCLRI